MKRFLFISLIATSLISCSGDKKIAYVENYKLYSGFDLTKELQGELTNYQSKEQNYLDSLNLIFNQQTNYLQSLEEIPSEDYASYNEFRNFLALKQKSFDEEVMLKSQEYDQQIWERINTYVTTYAEENEFDVVLGASGNGSLMYAKEDLDITEDLIQYCNTKYGGE
ncbi:MAG: OmpH family outer membrane protein [Crocinitomicaceae bacterium]|nr:OmpH family outer membrane protein [Crocinitomicaceae bacterium]